MADHEQHSVKADTAYVVLIQDASGDYGKHGWAVVKTVDARDATAAIKAAHSGSSAEDVYVAVPARSWNPVVVKPQVVTTLTLEQVKS